MLNSVWGKRLRALLWILLAGSCFVFLYYITISELYLSEISVSVKNPVSVQNGCISIDPNFQGAVHAQTF